MDTRENAPSVCQANNDDLNVSFGERVATRNPDATMKISHAVPVKAVNEHRPNSIETSTIAIAKIPCAPNAQVVGSSSEPVIEQPEPDKATFPDKAASDTSPLSSKSKGVRASIDSTPDHTRARQGHLLTLTDSSRVLNNTPCHGKRLKPCHLSVAGVFAQGGKLMGDSLTKSAPLFGKHREIYAAHRDAHKCQRQDFWETGIMLQVDTGPIQECRIHIQ